MSETYTVPKDDYSNEPAPAVRDQAAAEDSAIDPDQPLFNGACYCGAITFKLSSLPIKSYLCHCLDCRRITGTSFAHNVPFLFSSLTISTRAGTESTGDPSIKPDVDSVLSTFGDVETGRLQFCKICGTRLFLLMGVRGGGKPERVVIPAGVIDGSHEDERLRPTAEGFCKRREAWMPDMKETKLFEEW